MRTLLLVFCFCFFCGTPGQACICMGEPLDSCLKNNGAIFIGVLTQIVRMDSLFMAHDGRTGHSTYFNFRVLKYYKGLGRSSDYVSVFATEGSCGGYCAGATPGDTMLLFSNYIGDPYSGQFLSGSQCERARKLSATMPTIDSIRQSIRNGTDNYYKRYYRLVPLEEEIQFLQDSTNRWFIPDNKDSYFEKNKPEPKDLPGDKTVLNWPLLASILLNLLLAVLLWLRQTRE
ncbi:MAG: hypothetical protein IPM36_21190 [Lewinellaceae bacterium]|nr:hypothetical protein [Lewinellaceae bacterium]